MIGSTNAASDNDTKSTLIITINAGSTVVAYGNAACTTKVKDAVEKSGDEFWITGLDNGTYYIKATLEQKTVIRKYTINEFGVYRIEIIYTTIPEFTYTDGTYGVESAYEIVQDDDTIISDPSSWWGNWKIRFLESGVLNISQLNGMINGIDVFLVGGGGGGASSGTIKAGAGGGCTTTDTSKILSIGTDYAIAVGAGGARGTDGNTSTGFDLTAPGGATGTTNGGAGGSGGGGRYRVGGSDGADGVGTSSYVAGTGQHTTTREFGGYTNTVLNSVSSSATFKLKTAPTTVEQAFLVSGKYLTIGDRSTSTGNAGVYPISSFNAPNEVTLSTTITATAGDVVRFGNLYSGGGGGGASSNAQAGGYGGGGAGAAGSTAGKAGTAHTGGGGGGASADANGGVGGSGIVIIRNARGN